MFRRGQRRPVALDRSDPHGLGALLGHFLEWERVSNYSARTIESQELVLRTFLAWCAERGLTRPHEITRPVLERYQRHLFHRRKTDGRPLSFRSQKMRLLAVRAFFKWLARQNHILYNPAAELVLPRLERRLPKYVLSAAEAEAVLRQADLADPLGLRDRAILETLYSTGLRRRELCSLDLYDLDAERGTVLVRQGKGRKDRMIPIGERALAWIDRYLAEVRPSLVVEPDPFALFLTVDGERLSPDHLSDRVSHYIAAAKLGKQGACHLFRHTLATLMLEGGADIRYIQQMLGHASLETTQIYTQVSIQQLKQIHAATHPARMERRSAAERSAAERSATQASGSDSDE
jgi:integrase/recombinase XerD